MKYRTSFVTNSSSSSYICEICGEGDSGFDMSITDIDMFECENGHVLCGGHALGDYKKVTKEIALKKLNELLEFEKAHDYRDKEESIKKYEKDIKTIEDANDENLEMELGILDGRYAFIDPYYISPEFCPICQMAYIEEPMLSAFAVKKLGMTKEEIAEEIRKTYSTYKEMKEDLE